MGRQQGRHRGSGPRKERHDRQQQRRGSAGRPSGGRNGPIDRGPVLRPASGRHGRRNRQAGAARNRRPDAPLGPGRPPELVARHRTQQIFGRRRPAQCGRATACPRPHCQSRHIDREFSSRHARKMEPRPRRAAQDQSGPDRRARIGLWPDRPLFGARRIRRHRRSDGRLARDRRLSRPAAGTHGRVDRRHAGRDLWLPRRARGAPSPQQDRRGPDRRTRHFTRRCCR